MTSDTSGAPTMNATEAWWAVDGERIPVVTIRRAMATVYGYFVANIHGGGSGSSVDSGAPMRRAWQTAVHNAPLGTRYQLIVQTTVHGPHRDRGIFSRGSEPWVRRAQ